MPRLVATHRLTLTHRLVATYRLVATHRPEPTHRPKPTPAWWRAHHTPNTAGTAETNDSGPSDCLRFDYGDWDEGYGERADVRHAVDWARERYDRVGLFGFSFGGTLSLLVASETHEPGRRADTGEPADTARPVDAVSALAPTARIDATLGAAAALPAIDCPTQVVYGTRDDTADWEPVVAAAEDADATTVELAADHFFVGQADTVADHVAGWLPDAIDRVGP